MKSDFYEAVKLFREGKRGKVSVTETTSFKHLFPALEIFKKEDTPVAVPAAEHENLYYALTQRQRESFIKYYLYKTSILKISEELNIKKSTAQEHLQNARKKVENYFTEELEVV